jgi:cytochrome P450
MAPGTVVANYYSLLLGAAGTLPQLPALALAGLARTGGFPGWARHPELLDTGVEECLRWASPAKYFMRHATRSVRLGAVSIGAGQPVVAWIGAANRDPAVFPDPDVLDVRRRPNRHLAFGAGPHYCLGAHLARLALRTLFRELFTLFEDVELAGTPVPVRSVFLAGFRQLPVRGHPRRAR